MPLKSSATAAPSAASERSTAPWGFLEYYTLGHVFLPGLLYLPGTQSSRVLIRVIPFSLSLLAWVWVRMGGKPRAGIPAHPARPWLLFALAYVFVMIFHPATNTLTAGLAQVMLYASVLAPAFWAPLLLRWPEQIPRVMTILLFGYGLSTMVALLQVYYPDTWMPREFSKVVMNVQGGLQSLTYIGPSGQIMLRPPGLSDSPGAASAAGMYSAILGLIFFLSPASPMKKAFSLALSLCGVVVIYLTQVRTCLLILLCMLLAYMGRLLLSRWKIQGAIFMLLFLALLLTSLPFAFRLGGKAVESRFSTLVEKSPIDVYYESTRGEQLTYGFTHYLVQYPLGAGLGRWGMMRYYFGDEANLDSPMIWAELQFPAWILDGGAVLLLLYSLALIVTIRHELLIFKRSQDPVLKFWSAAIFALNMGTIALVFGFTPFTTQIGLQFWLLSGISHRIPALQAGKGGER